jgi:hypothetical protein
MKMQNIFEIKRYADEINEKDGYRIINKRVSDALKFYETNHHKMSTPELSDFDSVLSGIKTSTRINDETRTLTLLADFEIIKAKFESSYSTEITNEGFDPDNELQNLRPLVSKNILDSVA